MERVLRVFFSIILPLTLQIPTAKSATYYTRGSGGYWGTLATWSTVACNGAVASTIPGINDDVIICNSYGTNPVTVTVNGVYSCKSLTIGTGDANATVQTNGSTYSLTITNGVSFNTGDFARTFILSVSSGKVYVGGLVSWNTANGTNKFTLSSGTLTFAEDLGISNENQLITITSNGKLNFSGNFTDSQISLAQQQPVL